MTTYDKVIFWRCISLIVRLLFFIASQVTKFDNKVDLIDIKDAYGDLGQKIETWTQTE